jgi:PBSX family phage terminase large subunit
MKKVLFRPSPKMRQVYREIGDARFRLLEGAVRSAKTFLSNDIALKEMQELPSCNILVSGYSISSVARNVVAEWRTMIDPNDRGLFRQMRNDKDDYLIIDWRGLKDKRFYIRGAGKEHDYKQIQGATFGYWYGDEWSRHCESFTDMALSRLTPPFAKALLTTNPDSPFHYIKRRFIDDPKMYENGMWKRWQFDLRDNPSLSTATLLALESIYSGVFFKRFILGLWCLAEGAIYDFFDCATHTVESPPAKASCYTVSIDYGTGNPTSFGLYGQKYGSKIKAWKEREWYYDSRANEGRQKTDAEYSYELRKFLGPNIWPSKIIVDPSAASLKVQLVRDGFTGITDADNSVLDGIRTQARMLKAGEYVICRCCKHTIAEYDGYVWDETAQAKGEDKPVKQADHTKDEERYFLHTTFGSDTVDYNKLTQM